MMQNVLFSVGKDKNGDWDFGVRADIMDLPHEEMNKFRAMLVVGIGTAEDMWRREWERKLQPAAKSNP